MIAGPRLSGLTKFDTCPGGGGNNGMFSISDTLVIVTYVYNVSYARQSNSRWSYSREWKRRRIFLASLAFKLCSELYNSNKRLRLTYSCIRIPALAAWPGRSSCSRSWGMVGSLLPYAQRQCYSLVRKYGALLCLVVALVDMCIE